MRPSSIFVDVLLAVWLAYGGYTSARSARRGGTDDKGSRLVLFLGIFSPFAIGFTLRHAGIGVLDPALADALAWLGGAVMLCGIVLWATAIATLGEMFSLSVDTSADHRVVDTGVFARIRHPAYTGMLTALLGYGLASGDWIAAVVFAVVPAAAFLYRIGIEERVLVARFGDEYRDYMCRTRRLVPFVY